MQRKKSTYALLVGTQIGKAMCKTVCRFFNKLKIELPVTPLAVQWLRLCSSNVGGSGSIPCWGTKIPHAIWSGQKKK